MICVGCGKTVYRRSNCCGSPMCEECESKHWERGEIEMKKNLLKSISGYDKKERIE